MNEKELSLQIAEDYKMVCKEAKEMGFSKVKALYNIPLKNMECMIHALEYYASSLLPEKESVDFKNKGCETDKNRVCYSRKVCSYSGKPIDFYARKCNAYELSEGSCTSCSELSRKNKNK